MCTWFSEKDKTVKNGSYETYSEKKVKRKYCRKTYKKNKKVGHERERKRETRAQRGMRPGKADESTDMGAPGGKILVLSFLQF